MDNFCSGASDDDSSQRKMKLQEIWFHPPSNKISFLWSVSSFVVSTLVSFLSKFWLQILNRTFFHNREQFLALLEKRPNHRGLLTFSNHYSCVDDPSLWCLRKWKHTVGTKYLRWIPSAHNICFTNFFSSLFFSLGRCIPVVRGDGVYQRGIDFCLEKVNNGEWIHVFPEGKVNAEHDRMRLKWGVGRLLAESVIIPIVLPLYHIGLDDVLPNKRPYIPQIQKDITILVGDPIDYTDDLIRLQNHNKTLTEQRKYITDDIQERLFELRKKAEYLHENRLNSADR